MPRFRPATALAACLFMTAPALLPPTQAKALTQPVAHGIAVGNMDPSVQPGNDFYLYANGAWIARTRIPADRAAVGVFTALREKSRKIVVTLVEEAARSNGEQTIDEDIADLGGVAAAYQAYHDSLNGRAAPEIGGFSGEQQFFIAFGQNWGSKVRPAALRSQVLSDSHAPAHFRAATVRNADAWYAAFDVKPGETLYLPPDKRVRIW